MSANALPVDGCVRRARVGHRPEGFPSGLALVWVVTSPVATSKAAESASVPLRLFAASWVHVVILIRANDFPYVSIGPAVESMEPGGSV